MYKSFFFSRLRVCFECSEKNHEAFSFYALLSVVVVVVAVVLVAKSRCVAASYGVTNALVL